MFRFFWLCGLYKAQTILSPILHPLIPSSLWRGVHLSGIAQLLIGHTPIYTSLCFLDFEGGIGTLICPPMPWYLSMWARFGTGTCTGVYNMGCIRSFSVSLGDAVCVFLHVVLYPFPFGTVAVAQSCFPRCQDTAPKSDWFPVTRGSQLVSPRIVHKLQRS